MRKHPTFLVLDEELEAWADETPVADEEGTTD